MRYYDAQKEKCKTYRGYKEWDPGHHDKHGGGEVDAQDVRAQGPRDPNLKPVHAVVAWKIKFKKKPVSNNWWNHTRGSGKHGLMSRKSDNIHIEG